MTKKEIQMAEFKMTAVKSSQIHSIGYHDGKLRVRFHDRTNKKTGVVTSGACYEYAGCPAHHHAGLLAADAAEGASVGTYFHQHIRGGGYEYRKLD